MLHFWDTLRSLIFSFVLPMDFPYLVPSATWKKDRVLNTFCYLLDTASASSTMMSLVECTI